MCSLGSWSSNGFDAVIIKVYAPQDENEKVGLWNELTDFKIRMNLPTCIAGFQISKESR